VISSSPVNKAVNKKEQLEKGQRAILNFTPGPWGTTSPLGSKFALGAKLRMGLWWRRRGKI
jgi:hypothetical protein